MARVPHIVGYQCAGVISEVGVHVHDRKIGDRVVAVLEWGSHAERVAAPAADTWPVPESLDLDQAAAVPVAWGTAHECGSTLARGVPALAYGGRIVTVGVSGREENQLDPVTLWRGNQSLHGVYFPTRLDTEHARVHATVSSLIDRVATGELRVIVDRIFPLHQAHIAHAYVQSRQAFGRVLMVP